MIQTYRFFFYKPYTSNGIYGIKWSINTSKQIVSNAYGHMQLILYDNWEDQQKLVCK